MTHNPDGRFQSLSGEDDISAEIRRINKSQIKCSRWRAQHVQRPRGVTKNGAFGELQMVQSGWESEKRRRHRRRSEVMERGGKEKGEEMHKGACCLETRRPNCMVFN